MQCIDGNTLLMNAGTKTEIEGKVLQISFHDESGMLNILISG